MVAAPDAAPAAPAGARRFALPAGIAAGVLVAAGGIGWVVMDRAPAAPAGPREPVSVLVANFDNQAKDEQFDGLIEQAMAVGIEGTSFVTAFPRRDALRIAQQIAPDSPLNEEVARLISTREGVDVIIAGAIAFDGSRYTLRVRAIDPSAQKPLLEWETRCRGQGRRAGRGRQGGRRGPVGARRYVSQRRGRGDVYGAHTRRGARVRPRAGADVGRQERRGDGRVREGDRRGPGARTRLRRSRRAPRQRGPPRQGRRILREGHGADQPDDRARAAADPWRLLPADPQFRQGGRRVPDAGREVPGRHRRARQPGGDPRLRAQDVRGAGAGQARGRHLSEQRHPPEQRRAVRDVRGGVRDGGAGSA